jgi:hypothetical protein
MREGEPHAAARTKQSNTPESLIAGVGASGALLAGAAIVFITLLGLVSFNAWPTTGDGVALENVELQAAANGASHPPAGPPAPASAQPASTAPALSGTGGGQPGGGGKQHQGSKTSHRTTPVTPVRKSGASATGSRDTRSKPPPVSAGKEGDGSTTPTPTDKGGSVSTRTQEGKPTESTSGRKAKSYGTGGEPGISRRSKHKGAGSKHRGAGSKHRGPGSSHGNGQSKK